MRIVITGATGNVGTAILRRLAREDHELVGLARRLPDAEGAAALPPALRVTQWRAVDLSRDDASPLLAEACAGADAVVHLAWGFQPSHDEAYLREVGVGGTRRVLQAAVAAGVPHLVHLSSLGAYSPKRDDQPVDESWPTDGVPTSQYSRHKVAAERLLDVHERTGQAPMVTRLRPGIVGQRSAGSALLRYGVPGLVPARLLQLVPVLPMDRDLRVPIVHADDVADAVARVLERRPGGAFNLAADPPLTRDRIAAALGATPVHVPSQVVRVVMSAAWHARLQQVDTGWLDLAFALPLLDSGRARRELDWTPSKDGVAVFEEVLAGMREAASAPTPALRPRTVLATLRDAVRRGGPVGTRPRP